MPTATSTDARFMAAALRLGRTGLGLSAPNPSVACLIVKNDVIIGRGVTARGGRPHAETQALLEAGELAHGATAYVTLEPCSHHGKTPPCAEALVSAGIARVVCALGDPDPRVEGRGFALLRDAGITVVENVLRDVALRDHAGHIARVRHGRPFIQLKMAVSMDEKIARHGERIALSGPLAGAHVHMLRAQSDAILIGAGTALTDDPMLTCRLAGLEARSPVRVVLDSELRLAPSSKLAQSAHDVPVHVFCSYDAEPARARTLEACGVVVHRVPLPLFGTGLELARVLRDLVKLGMTRVLVEGGARIAQSFIERDLVDEVILLTAPVQLGAGVSAFGALPLSRITDNPDFVRVENRQIWPDLWSAYERRRE